MEQSHKIYVAGHRGMVGSAIVRNLESLGFKNIVTKTHSELDLTNQKETEDFFEQEHPDYVFLAAAKVGGIHANSTYTAEFIYQNTMIAANVIHASYKFNVKKLLNLGSTCIYPKMAPQPLKEEYLLTGTLEPTNEPYALAKITAIKMCRYYNEQYGTNFLSVMPTNLYGLNDNYNLKNSHVLPAFIRKFHLAKLLAAGQFIEIKNDLKKYGGFDEQDVDSLSEEDIISGLKKLGLTSSGITLWGSGTPRREFLLSNELADACIFLMNNFDAVQIGEFLNVGTGEDLLLKDLAKLISNVVGYKGEIKWDISKPDGTPRKVTDVSRINEIGWKARIGLREGIEEVYKNY